MAVTVKFVSGLKEIGGTFVEVETEKSKCMFDFGYARGGFMDQAIPLREEFAPSDLAFMGVLPKTDGVYDSRKAEILKVRPYGDPSIEKECFILISHLHIDHIGGLGCLHPDIPVYMSEDSLRLYKRLVANNDVQGGEHTNCIGVKSGERFSVGDIDITPLEIDHDIKGACGFFIRSQGKTVCYTGDFRFHGYHSEQTFDFVNKASEEDVDVLIFESTMVSHGDVEMLALTEPEEWKRTEEDLLLELTERAKTSEGLLFADFYPRNVERVHRLIGAMEECGRNLVLDDMTADYVQEFYPEDKIHVYQETIKIKDRPDDWIRVSREDILAEPGKYMLQLEHMTLYETASFKDVASGFLHFDGPPLGDYDPAYGKMLGMLEAYGIPFERMGVSGHAEPYYLKYLIESINAKIYVPIHSFRPEQVISDKARKRLLPESGDIITL